MARRGCAGDVGDGHCLRGAQVEHAATCRVERPRVRKRDVDVVLERHVGPKHLEDIELGRCAGAGIGLAVLVRIQRPLVGVRTSVRLRDARHRRVGEHQQAVAGREVAAKNALAQEERVVVREILVGDIQLEELALVARECERNAANVRARLCPGRDPVRRIAAAHEELRARSRIA
ncbi:MAG TPA: hypothetical protein VN706_23930 [Gemmatimonadaceae bacterium]|nr:hypothetical protein [Gemmatimonadaceae bacterium]